MLSQRRRTLALTLTVGLAAGAACVDAPSEQTVSTANDGGAPDSALGVCVDGKPSAAYPPGPYELALGGVVPPGLSFDSQPGKVTLDSFFEPCAPRSRVLILRTSAAWCGPCVWQAAHTKRFLEEPRFVGRLGLIDFLVADEDNVPPEHAALSRWAAKIDSASIVAADPTYTLSSVLLSRSPLPSYVFVDTKTMQILSTMTDPAPEALVHHIDQELAALDGTKVPERVQNALFDSRWSQNEWDLIRGMQIGEVAPPPDPTNEYGDSPAAIALGKKLFSDPGLSPSGKVSCATCHRLDLHFTDGAAQSTGVAKVDRNAPSVALAAHSRWQFWDGRADTLWMQALGPMEDAREFGASRTFVARQIAERYASDYASTFGAKYPLPETAKIPPSGKPGDAEYDALSPADQDAVTRIFVNVGKAMAAYERAIRVKPNALDRYAGGDFSALTGAQKKGLSVFMRSGCTECHWGPRLTDDAFHAVRFPSGRQDGAADPGRLEGLSKLALAEFAASSKWSDAPSLAKVFKAEVPSMRGAFKTASLRGVAQSAPYSHGGTLPTLLDVALHYSHRGLPESDPRAAGSTEQWITEFDQHAAHDLPAFLEVLTGDVVLP